MGGIELVIYNKLNLSIDYVNSFLNIKSRGPHETIINTYSTTDISNLSSNNFNIIVSNLTKDELMTYKQWRFTMGYHRLVINDLSYNASQPFISPIQNMINKKTISGALACPNLRNMPIRQLICNGEIYNYTELLSEFNFGACELASTCDVEIILPLYINSKSLEEMLKLLDGDFSFILTENIDTYQLSNVNCFCVKDFYGVKSLYYVRNVPSNIYIFVSEIKSLPHNVINNKSFYINYVEPGNYWSFQNLISLNNNKFVNYYSIDEYKSLDSCIINKTDPDTLNNIYSNIQIILYDSIISRYKGSDKPVGILLSGGFDSCLITSIVVKYLISINNNFTDNPLNIFTIGDSNSVDDLDVHYSKQFIDYLENKYSITLNHHVININEIEVLTTDIDNIIYTLESYEPHIIRESIPFYYLLDYISKNTNVKVLLTGDGLDELCGYNHFINLNDVEFQETSVKLIQNMYKFNLLRTDKISGRFSLESRQPFINKKFIEYILSIAPNIKREKYYSNNKSAITKYIIRNSFDKVIYKEELMPHTNLWRIHSNITNSFTNFELRLDNYFNDLMSTNDFNINLSKLHNERHSKNTLPTNKQEMFYRLIFRKYFPNRDYIIDIFWKDLWPSTTSSINHT